MAFYVADLLESVNAAAGLLCECDYESDDTCSKCIVFGVRDAAIAGLVFSIRHWTPKQKQALTTFQRSLVDLFT